MTRFVERRPISVRVGCVGGVGSQVRGPPAARRGRCSPAACGFTCSMSATSGGWSSMPCGRRRCAAMAVRPVAADTPLPSQSVQDPMRHRPLIYMDHAATTRTDPRVVEAMLPYFLQRYGNAASRSHPLGWEAARAVDIARRQAADLLGASPERSSGPRAPPSRTTWPSRRRAHARALLRAVLFGPHPDGVHEHKSVLDACKRLEREGFEITKLAPGPMGSSPPRWCCGRSGRTRSS